MTILELFRSVRSSQGFRTLESSRCSDSNEGHRAPVVDCTQVPFGNAAAILLKMKETTVAVGGILLAAAGELLFLTGRSRAALFAGAFLTGLGLASLYPIYVAWLSKWFGARARKVGGVMFALAAGGASTMPALVGVVSRYTDSLRVGLLVPLTGCAVMLTVVALLRPNTRG